MKISKTVRIVVFGLAIFVWLFGCGQNISLAAETFSFAVFGDNRDGDAVFSQLIEDLNGDKSLAFAVNTGDFISSGKDSEYLKYLQKVATLKIKLYNTPGNHDLMGHGYQFYEKYLGAYYYSFDYLNSHFIVLNNAFGSSFDTDQLTWLKADLGKNRGKHIFIFMHRPTFDATEIYKGYVMSGRKVVEELMQLFSQHKVAYVFAGHVHGYAKAVRDGVTYIITAGGGAPLYLPPEFGGYYHYVKMTVDGDKISDQVKLIYDK